MQIVESDMLSSIDSMYAALDEIKRLSSMGHSFNHIANDISSCEFILREASVAMGFCSEVVIEEDFELDVFEKFSEMEYASHDMEDLD